MREITVRNRTSSDWLKRDCVVREEIRQGDYSTTVMRRCTYRVESQTVLAGLDDSAQWAKNIDPVAPRQVFVTKDLDPDTGGEKVVYKVLGHFYIVLDRSVFCIGYRHILSMDITSPGDISGTENSQELSPPFDF